MKYIIGLLCCGIPLAQLLFPILVGCTHSRKIGKSSGGTDCIEELVARYKDAHDRKDIDALRSLCWWEAAMPPGMPHNPHLEKPMIELFNLPLAEVRFVAGPRPDNELGTEAIYYIPGARQQDDMIGPLFGKLLLVESSCTEGDRHVVDPGYIIMRSPEERFYIDVLLPVAEDAARAYVTGTPPLYTAVPLATLPDARKGERLRLFP